MTPDCRFVCAAIMTAVLAAGAARAEVALIGVFPGKAAVLSVDGAAPRTLRVGQSAAGITVLSVDRDRADLQIDGRRRVLLLGAWSSSGSPGSGRQSVTLAADSRGHFVTDGAINGGAIRFMVDTGATVISIPAIDANRLGINYRQGRRATINTANGPAVSWLVKFDSVRIGNLELNNVDGLVLETGLEIGLLGMSFLNRVEMKRDGDAMILVKRF